MIDLLPDRAWADLKTAHGVAEGVGPAIEELASPSAATRSAALWRIDNHVVLQGDLYEAAPWAARALLELLDRSDLPDRALVLDLLLELARGEDGGREVVTRRGPMRIRDATLAVLAAGLPVVRREAASIADDLVAELTK